VLFVLCHLGYVIGTVSRRKTFQQQIRDKEKRVSQLRKVTFEETSNEPQVQALVKLHDHLLAAENMLTLCMLILCMLTLHTCHSNSR